MNEKIDMATARAIRRDYVLGASYGELAGKYGVSRGDVASILLGRMFSSGQLSKRVYRRGGNGVLTEKDVLDIVEAAKLSGVEMIANEYAVNVTTIRNILSGRTWKHVTGISSINPFYSAPNQASIRGNGAAGALGVLRKKYSFKFVKAFFDAVDVGAEGECWEWKLKVNALGKCTGILADTLIDDAALVSRCIWGGLDIRNLHAEQTCGNKRCCNPRHIKVTDRLGDDNVSCLCPLPHQAQWLFRDLPDPHGVESVQAKMPVGVSRIGIIRAILPAIGTESIYKTKREIIERFGLTDNEYRFVVSERDSVGVSSKRRLGGEEIAEVLAMRKRGDTVLAISIKFKVCKQTIVDIISGKNKLSAGLVARDVASESKARRRADIAATVERNQEAAERGDGVIPIPARGRRKGNLSDETVFAIRGMYITNTMGEIASRFGISVGMVRDILDGTAYKHLTGGVSVVKYNRKSQ